MLVVTYGTINDNTAIDTLDREPLENTRYFTKELCEFFALPECHMLSVRWNSELSLSSFAGT